MTPEERAYVAGIVDGEGTVSFYKNGGGNCYTILVKVPNTDRGLIAYLHTIVPGGYISNVPPRKPQHKPSFWLKWQSGRAADLLREIRPYLRVKAAQADLVMELQDLKAKRSPGQVGLPPALVETRNTAMNKIRTLNKRGAEMTQ